VAEDAEPNPQPDDPIPSDLVREDASFADLVQEFVDSLVDRIGSMEEALNEGDLNMLKRAAHQLKGSGGGHGYKVLTEAAARIEQEVISGDLESVRQNLDELKILISRVVVRLD
jgi:HPt (histidine-containing phosphotransfer) domain-containing protein